VDTGGAPPSATLLTRLDKLRLAVTHLYGLTETYGPLAINEWQPEWDDLEPDRQAALRARQGAPNIIARPLRVLDDQGRDVPADGETIGEIAVSGNNVMLGYYRDDEATRVTRAGCFLTGDLAVMHPDAASRSGPEQGHHHLRGENVASVGSSRSSTATLGRGERRRRHAARRWGEVPVAFVTLRKDEVDADALTEYARDRLARYKVPKRFEFCELPKTSTGKIQKNVLRDRAHEL
jgi:fatty-acyl-CoA synthase